MKKSSCRLLYLCGILLLASSLSGCVAKTVDAQNFEVLRDQFKNGTLRMGVWFWSLGATAEHMDDYYALSTTGQWDKLAYRVITADSGDDVGYYYLGLAAENLGKIEAAKVYYGLSIAGSRTPKMPTKCTYSTSDGTITIDREIENDQRQRCHGLTLPRDATVRLQLLETK